MDLLEVLKIMEFGARFKICFFDRDKKEVGQPIFHGNLNDFESKGYMDEKVNSILERIVKVLQSEPNQELKIVLY